MKPERFQKEEGILTLFFDNKEEIRLRTEGYYPYKRGQLVSPVTPTLPIRASYCRRGDQYPSVDNHRVYRVAPKTHGETRWLEVSDGVRWGLDAIES